MLGETAILLARMLALIALITQVLTPAAMAVGMQRAPELMAYFCSTPGEAPGAHQIGADLAAFLAEKEGAGTPPDLPHDCSDCVLGSAAALPAPAEPAAAPKVTVAADVPLFEVRFAAVPRGPPLGPRAPPIQTVQ